MAANVPIAALNVRCRKRKLVINVNDHIAVMCARLNKTPFYGGNRDFITDSNPAWNP
jgi:hypothetical protein